MGVERDGAGYRSFLHDDEAYGISEREALIVVRFEPFSEGAPFQFLSACDHDIRGISHSIEKL
ncbi:MAG: hypothetical protein ABJE10_24575 [bacterium]